MDGSAARGERVAFEPARDGDSDDRDPDESRDARDGVVDRRGDAGVALVRVRENRGRERRNGHREAQSEEEERRQHVGRIRGVGAGPEEEQDARGADERPRAHEQPRPVTIGEQAEAPGEREHHDRDGHRRQPGAQRAVPGDLLQEDHQEEEQDRQASVHPERLQVPDGEVPAAEQIELEHRLLRAALVEEKRCEGEDAAEQRHEDRGTRPPVARLLDQPEDEAAQP